MLDEQGRQCLDNSALDSFFSSFKAECTARKTYSTHGDARADLFDYIERSYNPRQRHSKLSRVAKVPLALQVECCGRYHSPMEFEAKAVVA